MILFRSWDLVWTGRPKNSANTHITITGRALSPKELKQLGDSSHYTVCIWQLILVLIMQLCVCSLLMAFAMWNSRRHAAGVCAGGAWQEQSSPGGSEDCRVDRSTPGLKRPAKKTWVNAVVHKKPAALCVIAKWGKHFFRTSSFYEIRAAFVSFLLDLYPMDFERVSFTQEWKNFLNPDSM